MTMDATRACPHADAFSKKKNNNNNNARNETENDSARASGTEKVAYTAIYAHTHAVSFTHLRSRE